MTTELNKVDRAIQDKLLRYPTMYRDRFQALTGIITESSFEWDENGCLVDTCAHLETEPATVETMLEQFRKRLAEAEQRAADSHECLARHNLKYITDAKRDLADAEFIAANLEAYTTTFAGCTVTRRWHFLFTTKHRGVHQYWNINNKPEHVDEDWRRAIYEWFQQILPDVNSLFGVDRQYVETGKFGGWAAAKGCEEIFNWAYTGWRAYQNEQEEAAAAEWVDILINEILAEKE